jgi:hypothetical protein
MATTRSAVIGSNAIMSNILVIRGHRVLLDSDLAALYQVETKALTRAVRRNAERFPGDFMFQLAAEESGSLRSQFGALKTGRGKHRKYAPYVFTEQGVAMLSSVLNSERSVQEHIEIIGAFVRLRETVSTHKDLARKLMALESRYNRQFKVVFDAIRGLMKEP